MNIRKKQASFERQQKIAGYIFIAPLIFGAAFMFLPNIIKTIIYSLNDMVLGNGNYTLEWKGFEYYYKALFVNADFIQYVLKMLVYVPTIVIFSLFISSVLNQKFKGRVIVRAIFFLPVVIATGIVTKVDSAYDLVSVMSSRDAAEGASESLFQMSSFLYSLNFNENLTKIVVSAANGISNIVNSSGMQIFIFLAAFQEIPVSSYEAAAVEGCCKWEAFWKITIPSVKSQIIVASVYTVIDTFTKTDNVIFNYIHNVAFAENQYSYAMSMYVIYLTSLGIMLGTAMWIVSRSLQKRDGGAV